MMAMILSPQSDPTVTPPQPHLQLPNVVIG
jgi:hypothetical protein